MPDPQRPRDDAARRPKTLLAAVIAVAVAATGAAVAGRVVAQATGQWVASVRGDARAPLPPHSTLTVSPQDVDDVSMRLQSVIEQGLQAKGYGVGDSGGSGLQLWFDTELSNATVGIDPARAENATEVGALAVDDEMLGRGTDSIGTDDRDEVEVMPQVTIPFGAGGPAQPGTPYSLTFIVGRPGETPIWQGAVTARVGNEDPFEVAQAMVPLLIDQIGKTVRAESSFPNP